MLDKSRTLLTQRPLWIISRYENKRMEVFTTGLELDGGFVGVFSFEEEAEAFLWLLGDEEKKKGWQSEQTTPGELVLVLLEACAEVKRVVLDPLPLALGREMLPVVSVNRDVFLQYQLKERRRVAGEPAPSVS
jgi:hypothetical protein